MNSSISSFAQFILLLILLSINCFMHQSIQQLIYFITHSIYLLFNSFIHSINFQSILPPSWRQINDEAHIKSAQLWRLINLLVWRNQQLIRKCGGAGRKRICRTFFGCWSTLRWSYFVTGVILWFVVCCYWRVNMKEKWLCWRRVRATNKLSVYR